MVLRFILAIAAIAILVTLGLRVMVHRRYQAAFSGQDRSLVAIARRQKGLGKTKATISGWHIDYAGGDIGLDEALRDYSVFLVEPIESISVVDGANDIKTWTRLRILKTITHRDYKNYSTVSPPPALPTEVSPPNNNEFFVTTSGGVLNIEGVEIFQSNESLNFEKEAKYLIFVNLADSRVGYIVGGPTGVFRVDNSDQLHSLNTHKPRLSDDIQKRFGLKFSQFESHVDQ